MNKLLSRIRNMSLIWKFALSYIMIIIIPVVIFYCYQYNQIIYKTKNEYNHVFRNQTSQIKYSIENKIEQIETACKSVSNNTSLQRYLQYYSKVPERYFYEFLTNLRHFLDSVTEINPYIYSFKIYKKDDSIPRYREIICSDRRIMGQKWFENIENLDYEAVYWHPVHFLRTTDGDGNVKFNVKGFSVYKKIYSPDYSLEKAYLEVNTKIDDIFRVQTKGNFEDISVFMLDGQMRKVFHNNNDLNFTPEFMEKSKKISGYFDIKVDGDKYLILYDTIKDLDLKIFLAYPYGNIFSSINSRLTTFTVLLLLGIITVFFMAYFVSLLILKRINNLAKYIKRVERGDFSFQIQVTNNDEIGQIKKTFNKMVINERIKLYYGEEYGIKIQSKPNIGTTIIITFPITIYNFQEQKLKIDLP